MDLLIEVRSKLDALSRGGESTDGVRAAIRHIEAAERWFERGRTELDDDLFNDVIYRTNQAFEGMLKEAFVAMTTQDGHRLTPFEIEQHLIERRVLSTRVLELFTNYRQKWRNPSTHDHRIFFKEQEALLAIVTVSAFANILLDEIIEAVTASQAKKGLADRRDKLRAQISDVADAALVVRIEKILRLFSHELADGYGDSSQLREVELLGRLTAFIGSIAPDIAVEREPVAPGEQQYRADLLVSSDEDRVLIELKASARSVNALEQGEFHLYLLLEAFDVHDGVLLIPRFEARNPLAQRVATYQAEGSEYNVLTLAPTSLLDELAEREAALMEEIEPSAEADGGI